MEKKKGDICIINKSIFTKDDNHIAGFTIPVNTRLIIDNINDKYFLCTLEDGYKIGIELEHDCSLIIITDNKKINKFKQQLYKNNQCQNESTVKCIINNSSCEDFDKKIIAKHSYKIELVWYDDGTSIMSKTNDGFTSLELLGLCTYTIQDINEQLKGKIKPDIINRKVIIDNE